MGDVEVPIGPTHGPARRVTWTETQMPMLVERRLLTNDMDSNVPETRVAVVYGQRLASTGSLTAARRPLWSTWTL